jgi:nicotinate-nucleotide pyrophosphorylase (carboxylating)
MARMLDRQMLRKIWEDALSEDGADNDITSLVTNLEEQAERAAVVSRAAGVFAGEAIFDVLKEAYPGEITVELKVADGDRLDPGCTIAVLAGSARLLLGIERTLLNFLQRLCGVATATRSYVDAVAGTKAKILDTRKTVPGWRLLDKYAVRCGGGKNHRMGLYDAILVKDNHLAQSEPARLRTTAMDIVRAAAELVPPPTFIEFEVDSLEQFNQLVSVMGIDIILLDNFSLDDMAKAVVRRNELGLLGKVQLEASGGVSLETVARIAATGVERIAVGAVTHSVRALDIGLDIEEEA